MIDPPVVQRGTETCGAGKGDGSDFVSERVELAHNAVGRAVPTMVNGKPQIPFLGVAKYQPHGRKAAPAICSNRDYPDNGDKRVADLETALRKCGLRDGMVISNHHHLRDGDKVALMALESAARIGVKDLVWFPSASFPSQKNAIELMEKGVIHHIGRLDERARWATTARKGRCAAWVCCVRMAAATRRSRMERFTLTSR